MAIIILSVPLSNIYRLATRKLAGDALSLDHATKPSDDRYIPPSLAKQVSRLLGNARYDLGSPDNAQVHRHCA